MEQNDALFTIVKHDISGQKRWTNGGKGPEGLCITIFGGLFETKNKKKSPKYQLGLLTTATEFCIYDGGQNESICYEIQSVKDSFERGHRKQFWHVFVLPKKGGKESNEHKEMS